MKHTLIAAGIVATLCCADPQALAQEPAAAPKPESAKPAPPSRTITPLRLQITLSRYQGEKKISSVPYSLPISIGGQRVTFSIGAQVPYATTQTTDNVKTPSYSYRNVGVGINVSGQLMVEPGVYMFNISVEDSSLSTSSQIQGAPSISGVPIFRNFSTSGTILLRDGQTSQLATAGDPITGEIMRVDVTLSVVK